MMNRLGPPVSGGVLARLGPSGGITGRLGPAVSSAQGNKNAPIAELGASKTNKAGQIFYKNQKVYFNDGKVFNASGKLLASGGKVNFQNGRLEYVVPNTPAKSPVKGSLKNRLSVPSKSPVKAPVKTPVTAPMKSATSAPAKKSAVPIKSPINAPAKTVVGKKIQLKGGVSNRLGPVVNNGVQSAVDSNKRKPGLLGTQPAKKLKKEMKVPDIKDFVVQSVWNVSPSKNSLELLCDVPGQNKTAILKLEKAPFATVKDELQTYLKSSSQVVSWQKRNRAKITLSNAAFNNLDSVDAILTYPAPPAHVTNLRKCLPPRILRETPEFYRERVIPYIRNWLPTNKPTDWEWIDTILKGSVSPDRIVDVYKPEDRPEDGFTLVKDHEWVQTDPNDVSDLHILGIVHRKDIFCLRSLTAEHLPLLKALYHGGTTMIRSKYGIQVEDQVVFLQYYPSTFHLHVHYTTWGKYGKVGRLGQSHLLVEVISNLEDVDSFYYRKATLNVLVEKDYEFLFSTQEGTSPVSGGQPLGIEPQQQNIGNDQLDRPSNGMHSQENVFKDPNDPFYQLQYSLMDLLTRFQDVLSGDLEFLRLPVKELMKNIMNQPRPLLESVLSALRELYHHMNNRPLDHMAQLEGVLAELLQFFQKNPLQQLANPMQNQRVAGNTYSNVGYLRGYEKPRYR